jgi:hypothetical protein
MFVPCDNDDSFEEFVQSKKQGQPKQSAPPVAPAVAMVPVEPQSPDLTEDAPVDPLMAKANYELLFALDA